jgi:hypothetical protein
MNQRRSAKRQLHLIMEIPPGGRARALQKRDEWISCKWYDLMPLLADQAHITL